jgi:phosphohistidine phosphatase
VKTLYLLRHAKSSWDDPELNDPERPLDARGERAASLIGVHLAQEGVRPDWILCSSARRAVQTLERVLPHLDPAPPVSTERGLYGASAAQLLERVAAADEAAASLLLVGHNPALEQLAAALIGKGDPGARRRLEKKLPTGAWVELSFACAGWGDVEPGGGELRRFVIPKDLV